MKNKKIQEMLTKLDIASTVLQGRCESLSHVSYEGRIGEEKALAILRAAYTLLMEANNYMVSYLDDVYKEQENVNNTNSSSTDTKPGMVPKSRLFVVSPPGNQTVRRVNTKRNVDGL